MKTLTTLTMAAVVTLLASGTASAQLTRTIQGEMTTQTGTIEAIEQSSRQLTIKTAKGDYETVVAPPEMTRFSSLKIGDKVTTRYYENVVVRFKKAGEAAVDVDTAALTATSGAKPGGTAAVQRTIAATVTEIDTKVSSITVKGPNGWTYSRKVADKKALAQLKVGDKLDITWTEALLVSVDAAK